MKAFNLKTALQHPEKVRELHIHGLPIKEFPEAIFQLKQLRKLELTSNQLATIPEAIHQLEFLETLILNDNQLSSLPTNLEALKYLKTIELDQNQFKVFPASLMNCYTIESISISRNALTAIPVAIANLSQLRSLHLDHNQLSIVPEELTQLYELEHLNLSNNSLTKLPIGIGNCTLLKSLWASQNKIKRLVPSMAKLSKLQTLALNGNRFNKFPTVVFTCKSLNKLSLSKCNLKHLPSEIDQLSVLEQLDLSYNKLTDLAPELTKLNFLRNLFLQSNKISALPSQLHQLRNLRCLNISKNPLTVLPDKLYELQQLEHLSMTGNWHLTIEKTEASTSMVVFCANYLAQKYKDNPDDAEVLAILHFINELVFCKYLTNIEISSRYLSAKQIRTLLKFIKTCRIQGLSHDLRFAFFQLLIAEETAPILSRKLLLQALSFKNLRVRTKALKILQTQHSLKTTQQTLTADSHLVFLGKSKLNTKRIKDRLEKTGLKVADHFSAECSHIVLGEFPDPNHYQGMELPSSSSFVILQAHQVMAYLSEMESSFLTTTQDEEAVRKLSTLLQSDQLESIALALQILKTVNIPSTLFTDLLIAFKELKSAKHKRSIRDLLKIYLNDESNQLIKELDWKKFKNEEYTKAVLARKLEGTIFEENVLWEFLQKNSK